LIYSVFRSISFKKAFKKLSSENQDAILEIVEKLANDQKLEAKYKDHLLAGNFKGCRECHVKPNLLLIYKVRDKVIELALVETGNHFSLFR